VKSEVSFSVYDALAAEGIAFPFPQRDLHLRSVSPEAARAIRNDGEPQR
jgi:potassium efflux system protein